MKKDWRQSQSSASFLSVSRICSLYLDPYTLLPTALGGEEGGEGRGGRR